MNNMTDKKVKFIARTAILLALTIVFQMMGRFLGQYNNFIVGPLVNAALVVSTATAGIWSGTAISVIAPFVSAFTNKSAMAPIILSFSPFIAAGNFILVLMYYLLKNKNKIIGIIAGAVLKFGFLYAAISLFVSLLKINPNIAQTLTFLFGWPQLLTALVGGAIALVVIRILEKHIKPQ